MAKRIVLTLCLFLFFLLLMISCAKVGEEPKPVDTNAAPSFVLADIDGRKIDLADFRGKVVILEFFATWCEPCRISVPELQAIHERYKERGVAVIAVAIDEGGDAPGRVRSFVKEYGLSYATVIDDKQVRKKYDAFALPTTVIIDGEGKIRKKYMGVTANYSKKLAAEIEPLLK